ncbi:MAG: Rrf2 family transcriptional regulator [Bacteroidota bacterium]|nr:Rrf2 family transcriptional regulator [Bacteroidota bacterium]
MSILFSRQCEYALQAIFYLALKPHGELTSIRDITDKLEIPYHFVAKILQDLTRKKLLRSHKGPSGGFSLGKSAKDITIFQIVEAIDGDGFLKNCLFGFPKCDSDNPCSVHEQWEKIREDINKMLTSKSIYEMTNSMKKLQYNGIS